MALDFTHSKAIMISVQQKTALRSSNLVTQRRTSRLSTRLFLCVCPALWWGVSVGGIKPPPLPFVCGLLVPERPVSIIGDGCHHQPQDTAMKNDLSELQSLVANLSAIQALLFSHCLGSSDEFLMSQRHMTILMGLSCDYLTKIERGLDG